MTAAQQRLHPGEPLGVGQSLFGSARMTASCRRQWQMRSLNSPFQQSRLFGLPPLLWNA